MTRAVFISRRAEADLLEIWEWTRDRFGVDQADRYLDGLDAAIRLCATSPLSGRDRSALRPGYRSTLAGRHIIFYTHSETQVVVQRVLHATMDPEKHLG